MSTAFKETASHAGWRGVIEEYRRYLPVSEQTPVVTMLEGGTPLIEAPRLSEHVGARVWLKFEGLNPTGSFKDRGMTVAVSKALERGARAVVCASTGNTSASAAAYAGRAGITCAVLVPEGKIALGKMAQALAYGAAVLEIRGNFDRALEIVRELGEKEGLEIVNSINPFRIEGQKTAAFEVVDVLGDAPEIHCIPVGNAGNITAYWKGYREYLDAGVSTRTPRMLGFQAEGSAPLVHGHPIENPSTVATAIRIGNPASWKGAEEAASQSSGSIRIVSDEEILAAQSLLATSEGVYCEPASAAAVAGLLRYGVPEGATVVCVLTGHGLKDPDITIKSVPKPAVVDADYASVCRALEL
jgi:threonine synthase